MPCARRSRSPNRRSACPIPIPRVGCVIVDRAGSVIGRGHTQETGDPHAEVMALRDAAARGADVRGATVVVSLEPCSHHGRTPPAPTRSSTPASAGW